MRAATAALDAVVMLVGRDQPDARALKKTGKLAANKLEERCSLAGTASGRNGYNGIAGQLPLTSGKVYTHSTVHRSRTRGEQKDPSTGGGEHAHDYHRQHTGHFAALSTHLADHAFEDQITSNFLLWISKNLTK
jgi:hypothetical protein